MEYILARKWWVLALRGVLGITFGVLAFLLPGITLAALVLLFGAFALADGAVAIAAALTGERDGRPWWALVLQGLLGIAAGVVTFVWPDITALALLYVIASWAILTGVFAVVAAIRLRKVIEGEWALALAGVLSVLVGVGMAVFPGAGALALVWLIAANAIASGILLLVLAFRLRSLARHAPGPGAVPTA